MGVSAKNSFIMHDIECFALVLLGLFEKGIAVGSVFVLGFASENLGLSALKRLVRHLKIIQTVSFLI